jgi:hypothetical protein
MGIHWRASKMANDSKKQTLSWYEAHSITPMPGTLNTDSRTCSGKE